MSENDGIREYRTVKWCPYEISLTPIPADTGVGVGRTINLNQGEDMSKENKNETGSPAVTREGGEGATQDAVSTSPTTTTEAKPVSGGVSVGDEAKRTLTQGEIKQISDIGREYGLASEALDAVARGERPEEFTRRCLGVLNERSAIARGVSGNKDSVIGMNRNEANRFSLAKAIRAAAYPSNRRYQEEAKFEFECMRAMGCEEGSGLAIPQDVMMNWARRDLGPVNGVSMTGVTEDHLWMGSFVEMLRASSDVLRRVTWRTGLRGNVAYPLQTGKTKASWTGIDEALEKTDYKTAKRQITPSKVGAIIDIAESAILYASTAVEQDIRMDITRAMAYEMARVIFYGSGADDEPLGLLLTEGINKVKFAGSLPTYAELVSMGAKIKKSLVSSSGLFYSLNSEMESHFLVTPRQNGMQAPILSDVGSNLTGRSYEASEIIEDGHIFLGDFSEMFVGSWDSFKIDVNPYASGKWDANMIQIKAYQIAGLSVRRPEAFCVGSI